MRLHFPALVSLAPLVLGVSFAQKPGSLEATLATYQHWKKSNPLRVLLSSQLDGLCRGPSPTVMKQYEASPHKRHTITVFVNPVGERAMMRGGTFPNGSILVKEKQLEGQSVRDMATVMIKRSPGYNPQGGDWEYAVLDKAGKIESRGRLANCISCHADQAKSDFVFRSYLSRH